jgi:hypothetical protein
MFRGREEEMQENFATLISVLDGQGFTSDTGMRGQRGYQRPIVFNWLGATTPLPAKTHRLMSQLGTRLLFYEISAIPPTHEDLLRYAMDDNSPEAEKKCQEAVNCFLTTFFKAHPPASVEAESVTISRGLMDQLVHWAALIVYGRAEVVFEKEFGDWTPVAVKAPEGPYKVINYVKELARGHALVSGRRSVDESDIALVAEVAISSLPIQIRPIIRRLRETGEVDSNEAQRLCCASRPTARKYLEEVGLLGLAEVERGSPEDNEPHRVSLPAGHPFSWLHPNLES